MKKKSFWKGLGGVERAGIIGLSLLLVVGVLGGTGAFDAPTKSKDGKETKGGFLSGLNPFTSNELTAPTNPLQLSKSYVYSGSRLLAVQDAGAQAAPPVDLAVWRPSSGTWWVLGGGQTQSTTQGWGVNGDVPLPGDFDGDGKTDFCVFRDPQLVDPNSTDTAGVWWILKSSDGSFQSIQFGLTGDTPTVADFDGDGLSDIAVFRGGSGNATWYVSKSSGGLISQQFGLSSDLPAPHDYTGDGVADFAVWRTTDRTFYSLDIGSGAVTQSDFTPAFGDGAGTKPVSGDYDGDGRADFAVLKDNNWHILGSSSGQLTTTQFGLASDIAVQNDYDNDGRVDIAVWRSSNANWYIDQSADGTLRQQQWGASGDIPVPALYRR